MDEQIQQLKFLREKLDLVESQHSQTLHCGSDAGTTLQHAWSFLLREIDNAIDNMIKVKGVPFTPKKTGE